MLLEPVWQDLRYGARSLVKSPAFTAAAALTIALGIGLNTAIFTLFDAVALRAVQVERVDQVVTIYQQFRGAVDRNVQGDPSLFSYAEYRAYRDQNDVLSGLAAYVPEFTAMLNGNSRQFRGQLTSCNYFDVLHVRPAIGRGFTAAECAAEDAGPVVVLSDAMWRDAFAADPAILGKVVHMNRVPLTVIGVAPREFTGTELITPSYWAPVTMHYSLSGRNVQSHLLGDENLSWLTLVGRLRNGATFAQARSNLDVIAARLDTKYKGRVTTLSVARPSLVGRPDHHKAVFAGGTIFLVAVGLVLLIACANVANLFLARATTRHREIAVRMALGASRGRIVRQLLTESLLVALVGGAIGTVTSIWGMSALAAVVLADASSTPLAIIVQPDIRILGYAIVLIAVTGVAFGLAPALQATRWDVNSALKQDDANPGSKRAWLRGALVGGQVTVCMVLLIVAGLLLRGLQRAQTVDPGFAMDGVQAVTLDLQREGYTPERAAAFHRDVLDRLRAVPGVDEAAEGTAAPLGGHHHSTTFARPGDVRARIVEVNAVSPGYLNAVRLPLMAGRDFTRGDAAAGTRPMIINESGARAFWPGEDAIGKTLHGAHDEDFPIVGVTRDAELSAIGKLHVPYIFVPATDSDALDLGAILVHMKAPTTAAAAAIRAAVLSVDPELHLNVAPLRDNLRQFIQGSEVLASLSTVLGVLALVLASIGIYGTVAYTVSRRTREIGIRMALGARASSVIDLIVRQSMRPVAIGAAIGTLICATASRLLVPVLFGVSALDGVAFVGIPLMLAIVALLASLLPARRASRVDPLTALRQQ
jgi:predicted permease